LNNDNDPASKPVTLLKAWASLRKKNALASATHISSLSEDGANDLLKIYERYSLWQTDSHRICGEDDPKASPLLYGKTVSRTRWNDGVAEAEINGFLRGGCTIKRCA